MKLAKFVGLLLVAGCVAFSQVAESASAGRSSSSSARSSSSSVSSSKASSSSSSSWFSSSKPSTGGIGGTSQSVGVRKPAVTNSVKQEVAPTKTTSTSSASNSSAGNSYSSNSNSNYAAPQPSNYGYAAPSPVTNGSTFMSSLGGSFLGSWIGSSIGSHGSGGTTIVNNGGGGSSGGSPTNIAGQSGPTMSDQPFSNNAPPKKEYTVWNFIGDLFGFVLLAAIVVGVVWLIYKAFKMIKNYIKKERGMSNPINPTQQFWEIQRAFGEADAVKLKALLGPDLVDELTANLEPQDLHLKNVSYEIRLNNETEFSVWYTFNDGDITVNQVWHYEQFGKEWRLNGIENI